MQGACEPASVAQHHPGTAEEQGNGAGGWCTLDDFRRPTPSWLASSPVLPLREDRTERSGRTEQNAQGGQNRRRLASAAGGPLAGRGLGL